MTIEGAEGCPIRPVPDPCRLLAIFLTSQRTFLGLRTPNFLRNTVHRFVFQRLISNGNRRGYHLFPCFWTGYRRVEFKQSSQGLARKKWRYLL